MYDDLVARLRASVDGRYEKCDCCPYEEDYPCCVDCLDKMHKQAADAIEELSRAQEQWIEQERNALLKSIPKWIPVTEALPEERINPNTRDFEYVLCVTIWGDVRPYKYGTPIGGIEAHFWNGAGYVDAYVTHWMPLPEPPKEEDHA